MDPVTIMLALSAVSAVGAVASGASQAKSMDQQARAAEANARMAEVQADRAREAGVLNETQQRQQQAQQLGAQRAAVAESGFDPNSGSALLIQREGAMGAEMDALQTRYEGLLRGSAYEQQAGVEQYQAGTLRSSAKGARASGYTSAALSLLSGAASYGHAATGTAGAAKAATTSPTTQWGGSGIRFPWMK